MKKLSFLFVLIGIVAVGFLNSCTEEEKDPPTIIISEVAGATYVPGTYVDYVLNISSNEELVSLYIEESTLSNPASEILSTVPADALDADLEFANNLTSVQVTYRYHIPATIAAGSTINIGFEVEDNATIGNEEVTITVVSAANPINTFTAVLMGAQSNTTNGSYLDAHAGQVYMQAQAVNNQALIDMVYYYGASNLATFAAPSDVTVGGGAGNLTLCEGWTTKNATKFGTSAVTVAQFDAMTNDAAISQVTGLADSKIVQVDVDDVFAFETSDGKKGLIKVTALTANATGSITITVKMQQ